MSNLNSFHGQGNLVADPELRTSDKGTALRFTVAINNGFGDYKSTTFVDCVGFGRQAEVIAEHFHKGDQIVVNGWLFQDKWEDNEGNKRSKLEVRLNQRDGFFFVGGRANSSEEETEKLF